MPESFWGREQSFSFSSCVKGSKPHFISVDVRICNPWMLAPLLKPRHDTTKRRYVIKKNEEIKWQKSRLHVQFQWSWVMNSRVLVTGTWEMYRKVVHQDVALCLQRQTSTAFTEIRTTGTVFSFLRERVWHKENLCTDMIRSTYACWEEPDMCSLHVKRIGHKEDRLHWISSELGSWYRYLNPNTTLRFSRAEALSIHLYP